MSSRTESLDSMPGVARAALLDPIERLHVWTAPAAVWQCGLDRVITWASDSISDVTGWTPRDLVGHPFTRFFTTRDTRAMCQDWRDEIRDAVMTGGSAYYEATVDDPTGVARIVAGFVTGQRTPAGDVIGYQVGATTVDAVVSETRHAAHLVDLLEQCAGRQLDKGTQVALTEFVVGLRNGRDAALTLHLPAQDTSREFACAYETVPPARLLERTLMDVVGPRPVDRSRVKHASDVLTSAGVVVIRLPGRRDVPASVRAYSPTAQVRVEGHP